MNDQLKHIWAATSPAEILNVSADVVHLELRFFLMVVLWRRLPEHLSDLLFSVYFCQQPAVRAPHCREFNACRLILHIEYLYFFRSRSRRHASALAYVPSVFQLLLERHRRHHILASARISRSEQSAFVDFRIYAQGDFFRISHIKSFDVIKNGTMNGRADFRRPCPPNEGYR